MNEASLSVTIKNLTEQELAELMVKIREIEQRRPSKLIMCWVDGLQQENKYEVAEFLNRIFPHKPSDQS